MNTSARTRAHERAPMQTEVKVWTRRLPASIRARDISAGGLFVEATEGLALQGSYVTLTVNLAGQSAFNAICRVVRREDGGAGLQFLDLAPQAKMRIDAFVASHLRPEAVM